MDSQERIFMIRSSAERIRGDRAINAAVDENYGEILKSGDNTLLRYKIFDGDGETLQLEGLPCEAVIKKEDHVVYSTPAEIDAENIVSFKITEVLPSDRNDPYTIEFIITQGQDTLIFPSDDRINLFIYPSSLSVDGDIIAQTPEARLNEIVIVAVNDATQEFYDSYNELVDTGVIQENINQKLAESEAEYAPRLTELEQNDANLTTQLAQKTNKGDVSVYDINKNRGKFDSTYFEDYFLEELSTGEINTTYLENKSVTTSKLADNSVTVEKADFIKAGRNTITDEAVKMTGIISSEPSRNHRFIPVFNPQSHSFVLRVNEGETYKIHILDSENWDRTRVVVYQNEPVLDEPAIEVAIVDDTYKNDIVFTPSQSGYLAFQLNSQDIEVPFVIEHYGKPYIDDDIVELRDNSVSPEKTTFFEISDENTSGVFKWGHIAISSLPKYQGNHIFSGNSGSVRFIKIEPNKTYKITPYGGDRNRYALATHVLEPKELVDLRPEMQIIFSEDGNTQPFTFTSNKDSQYLIVYLSSKGEDVPFKLEKISMAKGLIPEGGVGNDEILNKSVSPEKTTFIEFSDKNLTYDSFYKDGFLAYRDPEKWGSEGHALRQQDGEIPNGRVLFIPIEPDTTYTLTISGKSGRNRYALATSDLEPTMGHVNLYPELEVIFYDDGDDSPFTFTSKPDSSYLVLYLHAEGYEIPVQLEKGDTSTEYEQPARIKTELIPNEIKESNDATTVTRKYDFFYKSESIPDMRSSLETTKKDFIYGLYDDLADKYPELVSRKTLGYGYNTSGEVDENFPIYEYTFSPAQTLQMSQDGQSTLLTMPKPMLLTSGVHGDEKAAVYGLYEMFKQMIENPQRNYRVDNLKNSYVFKVIPLVSPGGYDRNTRNNPIGVNINRDFTSLQSVEAQIVVDWWQENVDAFGYFDVHNFWRNFGGRTPTSTSYHMSANPEVDDVFSKFIRNASDDWYYNYMEGYQDKGKIAYGFNQSNVYRELDTSNNAAYHNYGFEISGLIESARQDPDQISIQNTSATLELSVEVFMNYFLAIHDRFGD